MVSRDLRFHQRRLRRVLSAVTWYCGD